MTSSGGDAGPRFGIRQGRSAAIAAAVGLARGASCGSEDYIDTVFSVTPAGAAARGLPEFRAGSGFRNVRATAVFVQPVSESFLVGAGPLYRRMLGDAADSPVVDDRGSLNQVIFGIGGAHFW